MDKVKV